MIKQALGLSKKSLFLYNLFIFKTCIMDTVIIQLTTPKTMGLLLELEALQLLRVLKKNVSLDTKLSDKYAGKLPVSIADDLQKHIEQSRNEWENSI
jgi:hypothetical protein